MIEGANLLKMIREKLAEKFRQLQAEPSLESGLWDLLSDLIRVKRPRRQSGGGGQP